MKYMLEVIVIVGTLVITGRQPANKIGRVLGIVFVGFVFVSLILQFPACEDTSTKGNYTYSSGYSSNNGIRYSGTSYTREQAMTKEEADALRGTGYNGTRPYSVAEELELKAAQIKCKECGYHSDNGSNSLCDYCQRKNGY